ncbi:methyltransferase domain-containing protein [Pseudonocardia aurantiaca]|uniref:Protein-L-isoaspartate O-methyltransferase n=1 Tax=Pseudonocardia aurantiaca TaxID=75290 RepID=A0ABW4FQX5_9PSEU
MIVDAGDVALRLKRLADELEEKGRLRDPAWRRAFLAVRRHVFVPRFWRDEEPGAFPARWRMIDNATVDHPEWLDAVYSDRTLATELTGIPAKGAPGMHPQVTSSTTMPSLVMAMLEALDVHDGMDVLEIGTGTGYNAALLCERLGEAHVTTIDVGPELTALASVRLDAHDYHPHVVTGDGAEGVSDRAPFDRIVATCGLDAVPQAWIDQTRDGGKLLVNVLGPWNAFAMVLLTVHGDTASGPFLAQSGGFMPRRTDPERAHDYTVAVQRVASGPVDEWYSMLDPQTLYTDPTFGLIAQTKLAGVGSRQIYVDDSENLGTEMATGDGTSWAVVHHNRHGERGFHASQAGRRRLWDEIEALHREWLGHGRPAHDRYGLTVGGEAPPVLWLDGPDGPQSF